MEDMSLKETIEIFDKELSKYDCMGTFDRIDWIKSRIYFQRLWINDYIDTIKKDRKDDGFTLQEKTTIQETIRFIYYMKRKLKKLLLLFKRERGLKYEYS